MQTLLNIMLIQLLFPRLVKCNETVKNGISDAYSQQKVGLFMKTSSKTYMRCTNLFIILLINSISNAHKNPGHCIWFSNRDEQWQRANMHAFTAHV